MPAVARCGIFCRPVCYPRTYRLRYTDLQVSCCFVRVWNVVEIKKRTTRIPLLAHSRNCHTCNQTLKMKRRDNFNDPTECVCETTNLFSWKKCPCGKKQMLHFTIITGNCPLWRNEILCEILSYSNACNAAPCSDKPYTFQGTFERNAIVFPYIIL